jgi:hypothetical protein
MKRLAIGIVLLICASLYAVEVDTLLTGYLERDTKIRELAISVQKAELQTKRTAIQNGFDIELSTGTVFVSFKENSTDFSASPKLSVTMPPWRAAKVTVEMPLTISSSNDASLDNSSLSVSFDIISGSGKEREITILKAEHALTEAERALKNGMREAEKEFYTALQTLYKTEITVLTLQDTQYTKALELQTVQAQGFSERSSKYRLAMLEADSARRDAEQGQKNFEAEVAKFLNKCGIKVDELLELPEALPHYNDNDLPSLRDFDSGRYTQLAAAVWEHYINSLSRDVGDLTLSLSADFTYNDSAFSLKNSDGTKTGINSAGTALTLAKSGWSFSAGVEIPLEKDLYPALTFALGYKPTTAALRKIEKQDQKLDNEKELLAIQTAEEAWSDLILDRENKLSSSVWLRADRTEQYALYTEVATDMAAYYSAGIISENEYKKAETEKNKARVNCLLSETEIIMYKIDTALYLTEESNKYEK